MKKTDGIKAILASHKAVNAHVHTHLCDGQPDMTVVNIASEAERLGIGAVVLTPHFHKAVSDESESLYSDSDEGILIALREEIDAYKAHGGCVDILLSVEADILDTSGRTSLALSRAAEDALDLVSPTVNYHPLLPLSFVHLTYGRDVNALHESGAYARAAEAIGGVEVVLASFYDTYVNAVHASPYPTMVGHFLAAHSVHPDVNTWFGAREEHLPAMKAGILRVVAACKQKDAMIDLTGVHLQAGETVAERVRKNGFLFDLQRFTVAACRDSGVACYAGTDAHAVGGVGGREMDYYQYLFS